MKPNRHEPDTASTMRPMAPTFILARLRSGLARFGLAAALSMTAALPMMALAPSAAQAQSAAQRIADHFSSVPSMHGNFVQFDPNGRQSEGKFYIERPIMPEPINAILLRAKVEPSFFQAVPRGMHDMHAEHLLRLTPVPRPHSIQVRRYVR